MSTPQIRPDTVPDGGDHEPYTRALDATIDHHTNRLMKNLVTGKHLAGRDQKVVRNRQHRMVRLQMRGSSYGGYDIGYQHAGETERRLMFDMMEKYPNAPAGDLAAWRQGAGAKDGCPNCDSSLLQLDGLIGQCRDCSWPDQETLNKWKGGQ